MFMFGSNRSTFTGVPGLMSKSFLLVIRGSEDRDVMILCLASEAEAALEEASDGDDEAACIFRFHCQLAVGVDASTMAITDPRFCRSLAPYGQTFWAAHCVVNCMVMITKMAAEKIVLPSPFK